MYGDEGVKLKLTIGISGGAYGRGSKAPDRLRTRYFDQYCQNTCFKASTDGLLPKNLPVEQTLEDSVYLIFFET